MVQQPPVNAADLGLIPGSGRSHGEGNDYPLLYSCLENSMNRGAWWATVHGVTESDMTEWMSTHVHNKSIKYINLKHDEFIIFFSVPFPFKLGYILFGYVELSYICKYIDISICDFFHCHFFHFHFLLKGKAHIQVFPCKTHLWDTSSDKSLPQKLFSAGSLGTYTLTWLTFNGLAECSNIC